METIKNINGVKNVDELKELIANILKEASKFHPNYPVYGYDYIDGKIVSVAREQDLAEKIYWILIEEGQRNLEKPLGSIITNTPDEVRDIVRKHIKELT